jgi:hypothetical protein
VSCSAGEGQPILNQNDADPSRMAALISAGTGAYLRISDHVQEGDNVWPAGQVLQDLDLPLDLLLLDGLEHLDDAFLVVDDVDALEDLGVFASACIRLGVSDRGPLGRR